MISLIIGIVAFIIVVAMVYEETEELFSSLIVSILVGGGIFFMSVGIAWLTVESTFSYEEVPIELQPINNELVIMQNNNFVIKYDGYIKVLGASRVIVVQSDSVYATEIITTKVTHNEKIDKWTLKNQTNDTTSYFGWVNLYRNLNKN